MSPTTGKNSSKYTARLLERLKEIKRDYNTLLDLRVEEFDKPDELKTMPTAQFMADERRLVKESIKVRRGLGMPPQSQALLCVECWGIFACFKNKMWFQSNLGGRYMTIRSGFLFDTGYMNCTEHKGEINIK